MATGTVKIDVEVCKGCELCIESCPQESLNMSNEINAKGYHYAVLVKDNCSGCVNCALVCPDSVITVYRKKKFGKQKEVVAKISNIRSDLKFTVEDLPKKTFDI